MSQTKALSGRQSYMDVIRIVACVLVIFVHISAIDWNICMQAGHRWAVLNVINSLGMSGVPLFLMISGALFLREESELSFKYVWKKILTIFIAYIGCLVVYNIFPFLRGALSWDLYTIKNHFIDNVLYGGGVYHLWFLPILMVLYALSPMLKSGFVSKKNCEYYLVLYAVFGLILPLILRYDFGARSYVESFQYRFGIYGLTELLGYFIAGHYLHDFAGRLSRKKLIATGCIGAVVMMVIIVGNYYDGLRKGAPASNLSTPASITCFIFACSFFLVVKGCMESYSSTSGAGVLKYLASLTLGIYFIHPLLIDKVLQFFELESLITNFAVLTVTRVIVIAVLSGMIIVILKKIPLLNKLL